MKNRKVIFKAAAVTAAVCMLLTMLAGCRNNSAEVFSVNGEKVTMGEFTFYLESMKEMIAQESNLDITDENSWSTIEIDNKKAIDVAKEKALDDAVSIMVQVQKAKEEGITLTNDEKKSIGKQKSSIIQQYGGESGFNAQLKKWNISSEIFDTIMQNYMYASKLQTKYTNEDEKINNISDEDILAKYNVMKDEAVQESIFVKHILIMPKEATETTPEVTDDEAAAKAQQVLDRLNAGEDFDTLMREVSDDAETSYDGYSFTHNDGQMDADFDNAAYALAVGETSGVVKTRFGYHIIKRLPSSVDIPAMDDMRGTLISQIKSERYRTMVTDEWVSSAVIVKNEAVFNAMK